LANFNLKGLFIMKRFGIAAILVAALSSAVMAAGAFFGYPIVGGAAYCSTTVNSVCTNTVAAGPTTLTGTENVPADTGLSGGRSPQTVVIPSALLMNNGTALVSGVATTYTVAAGITNVVLTHSTTIDSSTITAPAVAIDGQRVKIAADHTVTTFAFAANTGQTLAVTTPTVLTASTTVPQGYEFVYVASTAKWYRMQ
jgi:hypothetical protein